MCNVCAVVCAMYVQKIMSKTASENLTIRLSSRLKKRSQDAALRSGVTLTDVIRKALTDFVRQERLDFEQSQNDATYRRRLALEREEQNKRYDAVGVPSVQHLEEVALLVDEVTKRMASGEITAAKGRELVKQLREEKP